MADTGPTRNPSQVPPRSSGRTTRAVAARLSLDGGEASETTAAAARSPAIGGLLRFSPHSRTGGTTGLSPFNRGRNNRTRFFEATSTTKSVSLGTGAIGDSQHDTTMDGALSGRNSNTTKVSHGDRDATAKGSEKAPQTARIDNINLDDLRDLAVQALLEAPAEATFYAGLFYSKTRTPRSALLLAQAYSQAQQHSSCLRLLEESNIIQSQSQFWTQGLLLACLSLAAQGEWAAMVEILEDACRLAEPNPDSTNGFRQGRASTALSRPLEDDDDFGWETLKESISNQLSEQPPEGQSHVHALSRLCAWRGRAYYETGHVLRAAVYWKRALRMDSRAVEAWQSLLDHALVTPIEAHDLLEKLDFSDSNDWLKSLYLTRIELSTSATNEQNPAMDVGEGDENNLNRSAENKNASMRQMDKSASFAFRGTDFDASSISISSPILPSNHFVATPGNSMLDKSVMGKAPSADNPAEAKQALVQANVDSAFYKLQNVYKLHDSPQVLAMSAKRAYRQYRWKDVLRYCEQLAEVDPTLQTGGGAAYVYVATLLISGHKRTLFSLAHEWVEGCPKSAQAWFAVGAYYSCCGRHHVAQRHFCRATRLDPQCTEAWIAFGCSFAACDESDQALASFRAAQRLSPGEHTSLLYMGMEYNRTNHLVLAQNFLNTALQNSGGDPLCYHELGVLASNKGDHREAIICLRKVLSIVVCSSPTSTLEETVELCVDPYWEATVFNLGHALRKTRQYQAAATCYARCISLCPDKCSGYSAYAFTCQMMGKPDFAVEFYHQALSCKPDDNFSTEMLSRALGSHLSAAPSLSEGAAAPTNDASTHRFTFPAAN